VTFLLLFLLVKNYQKYYQSRKSQLKDAISQGQVTNFYQLIWDTRTRGFIGTETLVRLNDPIEGILTPNLFLADIEANNLLKEMTYEIIKTLIQDAEVLTQQHKIKKVNINITGEHLKDAHFKTLILELNQLIPLLVLELTENELLEFDNQQVMQTIQDFKAEGILLAIDDFGTGYAGLQYLKSLPLDIIKIDQSYVAAIGTESQLATMLDALIELAKTFKIDVVAEGVETQAQADYLVDKGVYLHQGWKYHKACLLSDIPIR
jgi:sensor c-di-GMP phosphodiesterase-like protein